MAFKPSPSPPIWLDLETRSTINVKDAGVDRMAEDPTLEILTVHWALGIGPVQTWRGRFGSGSDGTDPSPRELLNAIAAGRDLWAHNARFDRTIWNAVAQRENWPQITIEQTRDSATLCRCANLPPALKNAAAALGSHKLASATFHKLWSTKVELTEADRTLFLRMVEYGEQDVVAMRDIVGQLGEFDPRTIEEWIVSERINDRGFAVDLPWCRRAAAARAELTAQESATLAELTGGWVTTPKQTQAARGWVELMLGKAEDLVVKKKKRLGGDQAGFRTETRAGFDKTVRMELREELLETRPGDPVADRVLDVLESMDEGAGAAIAKYDAVLARANSDGVLRGSYILRGAAQTTRFSAGGLQPHNLIRHKAKDVRGEREAARTIKDFGKMLRSTVIARPGKVLVWSDWSAIEARITPWLALGPDCPEEERRSAEKLIHLFATGGDAYLDAASATFGREIKKSDPERQIGKVEVLSLGFGGGVGAFAAMCRNYGVVVDNPGEIVDAWRLANPWAQGFYRRAEAAAMRAIRDPGSVHRAGRMVYAAGPGALFTILPDGTELVYPWPRIDMVDRYESGEEQPTCTFVHPVFGRSAFSGPICSENPTQAVAARLLARALVECDKLGIEIVMHTHDEIVAEVDEGMEAISAAQLVAVMTNAEPWAEGLPLAAEVGYGVHYQVDGSTRVI